MKIIADGKIALHSVNFINIKQFDKFATTVNNSIVIWRKLRDGDVYLAGEDPEDDYTCPQPNAVTDTGFPACFGPDDQVFRVDSTEYNDGVKFRLMNKTQS